MDATLGVVACEELVVLVVEHQPRPTLTRDCESWDFSFVTTNLLVEDCQLGDSALR